ncbi:MAG: T9SS type A sorting domain-containing protein [Ignavibacteria bacterium]|nr:T9SS type A sorting domain-containing protein [Ignavibacteria bacterium]
MVLLMVVAVATDVSGQHVVVDPSRRLSTPAPLLPGYFHNNLTSTGSQHFSTEPDRFNCLRTFEITWKLRTTPGHGAFIAALRSLRTWHENDAKKTDMLIIQINAMPAWLSSSRDSALVSPDDNIRLYETVKPADYARWDSLMRDMASVVRDWDFTPYYELWNEPDLHFWNGTEAELLELYRHTALAIKAADPAAKVGGFGMNNWNRGADKKKINIIGYYPDSLAERSAALAHLIDSCAASGAPLDFISWHAFSTYRSWVRDGYEYFERKLASRGFAQTLQIVTEYNASGSYRERKWHAPFVLSLIDLVKSWPRFHHAYAAYQDFTSDPQREFFGEWGSISRNGLIKPVHNALSLLSRVHRTGTTRIEALTDAPVTVFASIAGDTLRTLVSNYVSPPQLAGYEVLLYGDARINTDDLFLAGYDSWKEIDSTFQGLLPPKGDARIVAAFQAAGTAYRRSMTNEYRTLDLVLTYRGVSRGADGLLCRIDSTSNNTIFRYDSLLAEGYSRNAAVSALLSNQALRSSVVSMKDSTYRLSIPPNGIAYLELLAKRDPSAVAQVPEAVFVLDAWPNPSRGILHIRTVHGQVTIHDLSGQLMWKGSIEGQGTIDASMWPNGTYVIQSHGLCKKIVKQ